MKVNPAPTPIHFDLHGLAAVRLLNARPHDIAAVSRQLGPIRVSPQRAPHRDPQIIIRFVDSVEAAPLTHIALGHTAYATDKATPPYRDLANRATDGVVDAAGRFFVLRGKGKTPARVQIALDQAGHCCEIICQHGLPAVPYLIPILNLTVLANGALPLHAAAFVYNQTGVLVTGWSKGGKTEALLGFMARGAAYVADEWTYLFDGGRCMTGIPEPVRIWHWHLQQAPAYRRRLSRRQRLRLAALASLHSTLSRLPNLPTHRLLALIARQQGVNVPPQRLFGEERRAEQAAVDRLFFVLSSDAPGVHVEPIDPLEVARRMRFSLEEEQRHLHALYRQFRFAFPQAANQWLENSAEIQAERLQQMLAGKETYAVHHPYPVPIEAMTSAMEKVIQ